MVFEKGWSLASGCNLICSIQYTILHRWSDKRDFFQKGHICTTYSKPAKYIIVIIQVLLYIFHITNTFNTYMYIPTVQFKRMVMCAYCTYSMYVHFYVLFGLFPHSCPANKKRYMVNYQIAQESLTSAIEKRKHP